MKKAQTNHCTLRRLSSNTAALSKVKTELNESLCNKKGFNEKYKKSRVVNWTNSREAQLSHRSFTLVILMQDQNADFC